MVADKKNGHEDIIDRVQEVLFTRFRSDLPEIAVDAMKMIQESVYTGEGDPGQWSPNALAVIHIESTDIPSNDDVPSIEKWAAASADLGNAFFEHVNAAVVAVYPC